jgi:peroxiredoxin
MASEQGYVRRGFHRVWAWRAVVYVAVAVAALVIVLAARAAAVGPAAPVFSGQDSQGGSAHAARVGSAAPTFTGKDSQGKTVSLSEYRGKYVVLEWTNRDCPFTKKQYDSGNMQALQKKYMAEGVVWLTIASSAPGEQGYVTPAEAKADLTKWRSAPTDFLLDPDGVVGRLYDARATPHMVVIDRAGHIAYMGAIDDKPSTRLADVKTAHNYVAAALDALAAGRPVTIASTRAYGCSIKYRDS